MLNLGGVDEEERDRKQKGQEEADHDLCGDVLVCWDTVVDLLPPGKDTPQAHRDKLAFKIELDTAPDYPQDRTQDNDKVLAVDAEAGPGYDWISDVISRSSSTVEYDDHRREQVGKEDDEKSVADTCAQGDERGTDGPCRHVPGLAPPVGEEVPDCPCLSARRRGCEIFVDQDGRRALESQGLVER